MGKNLSIINDWLHGDNLRPPSINFVVDKSELEKKKSNMAVGERYTDNDGKEWEKTSYGWSSVPKTLSAIKDTNPKCCGCQKEIEMNHRHDSKSYSQSKLCFDCLIDLDTQRKLKGTYKNFEKLFIFKKQRDFVISTLKELKDALGSLGDKQVLEFINEFGDREKWTDLNMDKIKADLQKDIDEGEDALKNINEQIKLLDV